MHIDKQKIRALIDRYQLDFSLPAAFYHDPSVYQADLTEIFYKKWIYAGHISELSDPGCYFLTEFGNESVILAKGRDHAIRAFANVCRHRGSRICLENRGKASAFVCPYHAWTFELDGKLRSRREMPEGFDREKYGLKPVLTAVFRGMIFINLDPHAPDFEQGLRDMSPAFDIYGIENTKVACKKTFSVDANWKLAIENFMECYHCAPAHVEYSKSHALKSPKDYEALRPAMLKKAAEVGYQLEPIDHSNPQDKHSVQHFYNRSAMYDGFVTGSRSGQSVAPLLGSIKQYGGGAADIQLGPLTYAILYPDHAIIYRFIATDIQKTDMDIIWLVNENAEEGKDYNLDDLTWLWTVTTEADKTIILNNQRGVNSKFYEPGPLSNMETYVTVFVKWYLAQISE